MDETEDDTLAGRIDAILPQTQCGKCGYSGCRPYAEAIAAGQADINRCPPGGEDGICEIAELVGVEFKPFEAGVVLKPVSVAFIEESLCIGCTLCIQACPVDAIAGASKVMHTIIAALCTGCELCVAPCPVDCIAMLPLPPQTLMREQKHAAAAAARKRYRFRMERIERDKREKTEKLAQKEKIAMKPASTLDTDAQALIRAALDRTRKQAASIKPRNTDELTSGQQAEINEIEVRRAKAREAAQAGKAGDANQDTGEHDQPCPPMP